MIHNVVYYNWLVVYYPIEKWWTSSVGMMTFPINMESHKSPWFQSPPTSHQRCVFVHYQYYQYYQSYCGYLDPAISLLQQSNMMESPYENLHLYIYIFRMIFLSENLHKPSLFRSFSHAFPSLFLWFSLWFFRWIRWGSSRASAEPFGLQHAVLSHRQRLDAIRLHLDGIEKSQAVSGNPWDVSVSHGSLEKAANNQKLRYHGYIIWDICIG